MARGRAVRKSEQDLCGEGVGGGEGLKSLNSGYSWRTRKNFTLAAHVFETRDGLVVRIHITPSPCSVSTRLQNFEEHRRLAVDDGTKTDVINRLEARRTRPL